MQSAEPPGYGDVKPTIEAAIKAMDEGDVDLLFTSLVLKKDLSELSSDKLSMVKKSFMTDKAPGLRKALVSLADVHPKYNPDHDALEFSTQDAGKFIYFQREAGKWYITNHPPGQQRGRTSSPVDK